MTVEISNIKNEVLRHAAEVADLNDNTANSGKLDQKELSVFIREAVKSNCNKAEIAEVCNQVGIEHATDDVKASMEKLNHLQKLEKELQYQNTIIEKRYKEIKNLAQEQESNNNKRSWISLGCILSGMASCALVGAKIGSFAGVIGIGVGAMIGSLVGLKAGQEVSEALTDYPSNREKIQNYEKQAKPIEQKINELKAQMEKIQKDL